MSNLVETTPRTPNYQKYGTKNPLMRRVIERFMGRIGEHVEVIQPNRIVDLGCGEGFTVLSLRERNLRCEYLGLEKSLPALEIARTQAGKERFEQADIMQRQPERGWADLAICLEVLEHLDEPGLALDQIATWTNGKALLSVPWEPWFQMGNLLRGKYPRTLGNHPEHVQRFTVQTFRSLVLKYFETVEMDTCFPWIIAIASKNSRASSGRR
jgi:SAM-dependent methyltransferase